MTLDKIDPRYDYNPDVAPADGLRSTVYDKTHGILFLTSVASIEAVGVGDYLVTMRAKSIGDLDVATDEPTDPPADPEEPADPPVEEPGPEQPDEPAPDDPPAGEDTAPGGNDTVSGGGGSTPPPAPPQTGTYRAFDANELDAKARALPAGETIVLAGTEYGNFAFNGVNPASPITIISERPRSAHFQRITFGNAKNITLRDLAVWTDGPDTSVTIKEYGITSYGNNPGIVLDGILFRAAPDSDDYPVWNQARWLNELLGGALLGGANSAIRNCMAIGVRFGFGLGGVDSEMVGNHIEGYCGDSYRSTNHRQRTIGNFSGDAFQVDDNHADAFQSFLVGATLTDITVEDNIFMEWITNPANPLRAALQGVSFHNGPYDRVSVKRNLVTSSTGNGIKINRASNMEVEGNRVHHADSPNPNRYPWIDANGSGYVRNNEAEKFGLASNLVQSGNVAPNYSKPIIRPARIW
ncbi:hypothetical protein [Defluviimonas sp. SAOS-178_SWC]|uniref:hypothetical protein n=1 Tax=Defluviimonas sp. SAOS-178_SWC TaxID=3121287 RepID=UPI003221974D